MMSFRMVASCDVMGQGTSHEYLGPANEAVIEDDCEVPGEEGSTPQHVIERLLWRRGQPHNT